MSSLLLSPELSNLKSLVLQHWKEALKFFTSYILSSTVIVGFAWKYLRRRIGKRRTIARIRIAERTAQKEKSLLTIAGSRMELTEKQLRFANTKREFFLAVPADYQEPLRQIVWNFEFRAATEGGIGEELISNAEDIVPNVRELLERSARETAQEFTARAGRGDRIFNGRMFHLYSISTSSDQDENPNVTMHVYYTDYFTTQTIHRAFLVLKNSGDHRIDWGSAEDRLKLRLFWNGFGLNCMVCAVTSDGSMTEPVLLLGKRSARVSKGRSTGTWHVTANEALTGADEVDQQINISHFVSRSLQEEVRLDSDCILRTYIFNVGIVLDDMQPCLMALSFCKVTELTELLYRAEGSQDGCLEYDSYALLPFDDRAIRKALDEGGLKESGAKQVTPFSPTADSVLRNIVARGTGAFTYQI